MLKLGVNIDHIATLRQARGELFPDPIKAASICEASGADSIVCHLRQDRRHIQDRDLLILKTSVKTRLNLEMSTIDEIVKIALKVRPNQSTLVPEKRQELTTEGGLDVARYKKKVARAVERLTRVGIVVSLFIDPTKKQIKAAKDIAAPCVELHTGKYANAKNAVSMQKEFLRIKDGAIYAHNAGLGVNAGHGLDYDNVKRIAGIPYLEELNIGFSIVSEAVFIGLDRAVKKMKELI